MQRITISLPDALHERLQELADESGPYDSKSEAVRGLIHDLEEEIQEYESELRDAHEQLQQCEERLQEYDNAITDLERENERLRSDKRLILKQREEHTDLVQTVERQQSLAERREERRNAPAWRRAKWWLFGKDG